MSIFMHLLCLAPVNGCILLILGADMKVRAEDSFCPQALRRAKAYCSDLRRMAGAAGVTRPNRPGIDVNVEPPAVRMNDALGGILTFKLKVHFKGSRV